jgi:hypothetical protein
MTLECNNCHAPIEENNRFCTVCGSASIAMVTSEGGAVVRPTAGSSTLPREEVIRRGAAYLLDLIPVLLLAILHLLPIVGWILFGALASAWWLLRDINSASLGKTIVGSVVRTESGLPATTGQLVIRNVPLAIPALLEVIPIIGVLIGFIAAIIIFPTEILVLSATGRRLGDRLAGTNVFRNVPNATSVRSS